MSPLETLGLPPLPEALPRAVVDNHTHLWSTHEYSGLTVADSLRLAVRQNNHDMLMTAEELRSCEVTLEETK